MLVNWPFCSACFVCSRWQPASVSSSCDRDIWTPMMPTQWCSFAFTKSSVLRGGHCYTNPHHVCVMSSWCSRHSMFRPAPCVCCARQQRGRWVSKVFVQSVQPLHVSTRPPVSHSATVMCCDKGHHVYVVLAVENNCPRRFSLSLSVCAEGRQISEAQVILPCSVCKVQLWSTLSLLYIKGISLLKHVLSNR